MPNWKKLLTSGSNIQISALTLDADGVTKTSIDTSGNIAAEGYVSSSGVVSGTSFKLNTNGATAASIDANGLAVFNSTVKTTGLIIGSTAVTSTAAEINKLDGFTGDKDDLIYAKDLKATGVTATEFDYLDGVTSAIQTQIDSKTSNVVGNLGVTANGTSLTVTTTNGTNIALPAATTSAWGVMTDEMFDAIAANTAKDTNVEEPDASEETKGKVALASNEEAVTGNDATKALTPRSGTAMAAAVTVSKKVHELTAPTAAFSMNSQKITGLATPAADTDAASKGYVDGLKVHELTAPTAALVMNSQKITGVTDPTAAQDAATKAYVDSYRLEALSYALSDETSDIASATSVLTARIPYAFTVTNIRANVNTVSSSGLITVDINIAGSTVLSTKLTIDASEFTSATAADAHVVSDTTWADDAEIVFDIDGHGTGAKGLKVTIIGYQS